MTNLLPSAPMLELLGKCQYRGLRALHFTERKQVVNLVSTPWSVARSRSVHEIPMRVIPVPCLSNNYAYMWVRKLLLLPQISAHLGAAF